MDQEIKPVATTLQEAFDLIWREFVVNKSEPSYVPSRPADADLCSVRCLYRDPRGNACFIGKLIPDAVYVPELEGLGVQALTRSTRFKRVATVLSPLLSDAGTETLSELQYIHDNAAARHKGGKAYYEHMRKALVTFANMYELTIPQNNEAE